SSSLYVHNQDVHSFPTRRSSDLSRDLEKVPRNLVILREGRNLNDFLNLLVNGLSTGMLIFLLASGLTLIFGLMSVLNFAHGGFRSEEHTSELQSRENLVCRLLLE